MELISDLRECFENKNFENIHDIEEKARQNVFTEIDKSGGVSKDKIAEDKFAQCILTQEIKDEVASSPNEMVIAGR